MFVNFFKASDEKTKRNNYNNEQNQQKPEAILSLAEK